MIRSYSLGKGFYVDKEVSSVLSNKNERGEGGVEGGREEGEERKKGNRGGEQKA